MLKKFFMAAVTICSTLEPSKIKHVTVSIVSHLLAMKLWDHDLFKC